MPLTIYRISDMHKDKRGGGTLLTYGCCGSSSRNVRSFLTKEERVTLLKEYKNDLEKETQGVTERIKELEAN